MMKKTIFTTAIIAAMTLTANFSFAQDADNCKDHPLVNRMPGFYLSNCEESYNEIDILIGADKTEHLEGTVSNYEYYITDGAKIPSRFQILKNYENAIDTISIEEWVFHQNGKCLLPAPHRNPFG